jgi:hypothetical protein
MTEKLDRLFSRAEAIWPAKQMALGYRFCEHLLTGNMGQQC